MQACPSCSMFLPVAVSRERRGTQHIRHKHPLALIAGSDTPKACTAFGDARRQLAVRPFTAAAHSTCNMAQNQLAYAQYWLGFLRAIKRSWKDRKVDGMNMLVWPPQILICCCTSGRPCRRVDIYRSSSARHGSKKHALSGRACNPSPCDLQSWHGQRNPSLRVRLLMQKLKPGCQSLKYSVRHKQVYSDMNGPK